MLSGFVQTVTQLNGGSYMLHVVLELEEFLRFLSFISLETSKARLCLRSTERDLVERGSERRMERKNSLLTS